MAPEQPFGIMDWRSEPGFLVAADFSSLVALVAFFAAAILWDRRHRLAIFLIGVSFFTWGVWQTWAAHDLLKQLAASLSGEWHDEERRVLVRAIATQSLFEILFLMVLPFGLGRLAAAFSKTVRRFLRRH